LGRYIEQEDVMSNKENWRQLQDGFLWRLFVSYHKKTGRKIPQSLTLCYYVKKLIIAAVRWFFIEKVVWIFSPGFFLWLAMLVVYIFTFNADAGFPAVVRAISLLFCFFSAGIYGVVKFTKFCEKIGTKIKKKGFDKVVPWVALSISLIILYGAFSDWFTKSLGKSLLLVVITIVGGFIAFLLLIAVLMGISFLAESLVGKSRNWRLFTEWIKAVKKKICPIIFKPNSRD